MLISKRCLFQSIFVCISFASFADELIHVAASPRVEEGKGEVLIEGFTLVKGGTLVEKAPRKLGVTILLDGKGYEPLVKTLQELFNHPLNDDLISQAKKKIVDYFKNEKQVAVIAVVPIQKIVNNNLVFQILQGQVGKIEYKGQNWFSEKTIAKRLGIQVGDPINEVEFLNDVTWLNRNPFIHTQMILAPGAEREITNLTFASKDRFPARFYAGSDNLGYITNGTIRLYAGFTWGDAFRTGDLLSYQYTASTNFHNFQSHVVNYSSFLPWKNVLTVFACYGQVYPVIPSFSVNGINVQGSVRYEIPILPLYGSFRSSSTAGFDYKYLTSNLFFVGNPLEAPPPSNQIMAITQFLANYQCQRNWLHDFLSFRIDFFFSPWKDGVPHQTTAAYNGLRAGSHVRYGYWKIALNEVHKTLSKWTYSFLARGQISAATLPTSEQFGLGGADTVRGYYEQQFVADDAFCFNFEVYPPPFPLFKRFKNELSFLAFCDYGYGYNYTAISPEFIKENLLGIGPGLRFDIPPYLNVRMDYGFQVFGVPGDQRTGRFHFSAIASY